MQIANADKDTENPCTRLVGLWIGAAPAENRTEASQTTKKESYYMTREIPLLAIYLKKTETLIPKDTHSSIVYCQDTEAT